MMNLTGEWERLDEAGQPGRKEATGAAYSRCEMTRVQLEALGALLEPVPWLLLLSSLFASLSPSDILSRSLSAFSLTAHLSPWPAHLPPPRFPSSRRQTWLWLRSPSQLSGRRSSTFPNPS